MKYLLDTMALLAFFNDEKGADFIEDILKEKKEIFVSSITLTEIYYIYSRRIDIETAEERVDQIRLNIDVIDIGENEAINAGRYKIKNIPIADALIASCAESIGACIVTADDYFEHTDVEIVRFRD